MRSIQPSRSPSSERFCCGPIDVVLRSDRPQLHAKVAETLALFDRHWPKRDRRVEIAIEGDTTPAQPVAGTFLRCARMVVDGTPEGLEATTIGGVRAKSLTTAGVDRWTIGVPRAVLETDGLEDVEEVALLAVTSGWRAAGWVPIHAAAVTRGERCVLICAASGGGKSTLAAALMRAGWCALGDDKVLLAVDRPHLMGLQHTFNLDPRTRRWFPEVGDLEQLPRYSTWTHKRKVHVGTIWAGEPALGSSPTDVVVLRRDPAARGMSVRELGAGAALAALLRQTVIPAQRRFADPIVAAVAAASRKMRAFDVVVGEDAYADAAFAQKFEAALR